MLMMYMTNAPNTESRIIAAVKLVPSTESRLSPRIATIPTTPPAMIARCGVPKRDNCASPRGKKPARARANSWREYPKMMPWKLATNPNRPIQTNMCTHGDPCPTTVIIARGKGSMRSVNARQSPTPPAQSMIPNASNTRVRMPVM